MYEAHVWAIFFAQVVAMRMHPGYEEEPNLGMCAALADGMLEKYRERWKLV